MLAAELGTPEVRDVGLLDSAAHRCRSTTFGEDAYPDLPTKAAALLSSVVRDRALVDGNRRLAWLAAVAFCDLNGQDLCPPSTDAAYDLVIAASTEAIELAGVASLLEAWLRPL